jgi:hypothetical protein
MTTTRRSPPEERKILNLPLFLVTLPRMAKSQQIFQLPNLGHIAIKVEAYRTQNAHTQCHDCQQFRHVWANCKQIPGCLWCGGGHLHKECPERENAASTTECCNCKLLEGEQPHPTNYRGCRHAREELQKRPSNLSKLGLENDPICERCLEADESAAHILCDCEALAFLRFRHLGQFFMKPSDFMTPP